MQALHSKVSMAMFCGEVAQRNIFILRCACGGRPAVQAIPAAGARRPGAPTMTSAIGLTFRRKALGRAACPWRI